MICCDKCKAEVDCYERAEVCVEMCDCEIGETGGYTDHDHVMHLCTECRNNLKETLISTLKKFLGE